MATFEAMGATLYYETVGDGVPVLFLHGLSLDLRVMRGPFEPVFDSMDGFKRIYVDVPGSGRSTVGTLVTSDDLVAFLLAFIDAIIPDTPFALAGFSYGAYLAQGIAHRRPSSILGIALVCPVIVANDTGRILPPRTILMRDTEFFDSLPEGDRAGYDATVTIQTRAVYETVERDMAPMPGIAADAAFNTRLRQQHYSLSFDVAAPEPVIAAPVLILAGRQDAIVGYAQALRLDAKYPRATLAALDGAAHVAQYERQPVFEALARDWLRRMQEFAP